MSKAINQYLSKYAETESKEIYLNEFIYDFVCVIPVCNENFNCLEKIFSHNLTEKVLIIVVVNSPEGKTKWQKHNANFIDVLKSKSYVEKQILGQKTHLKFKNFPDVLLVDKNSQESQLNPKKGVGLARKIGSDIALKIFTMGLIKTPWVFSTDADVTLPKGYFFQVFNLDEGNSAIVCEFKHISDSDELKELQFYYDFKLRYYLSGITYAGSAYNYIPLGSTLIVNMQSYAQVRGFPKKSAGEDFYLLNKLAKVKPIFYNTNCVVEIRSRLSARVPFGTGPALLQIQTLDKPSDCLFYHPKCFIELKKWIFFIENLWNKGSLDVSVPTDANLKQLYEIFDCNTLFNKCIKQIKNKDQWNKFIFQWFDAFKTLKTIHFFDKKFNRLKHLQLLNNPEFDKVTSFPKRL